MADSPVVLPSADVVLSAIESALGDQDAMISGFTAIYPQVLVLERGPQNLILDLWANDQPYAALIMDRQGQTDRATLTYWDPESRVAVFAQAADLWAKSHIGPMVAMPAEDGLPKSQAQAAGLTLIVDWAADGDESQLDVTLIRER